MISKMYCIHDCKVGAYDKPWLARSRGEAIRSFADLINSKDNNMVSKHPEDYTLFEVGEFSLDTGNVTPHPAHINVGKALEFKELIQ